MRLNPDDVALLNQAEIITSEQSWVCVADSSVTAGGCMIESDTSHIDSSVESQVQQLIEQLSLYQSSDGSGGDDATE